MLAPHVCLIGTLGFLVYFSLGDGSTNGIGGGILQDPQQPGGQKYGPLVRIGLKWVLCGDPAEIRRIWGMNSGYHRSDWYKAVRLNSEVDNKALRPCDLARTMQYLTQDVITAVGFGKPAGCLEANSDMYGILETSEALYRPIHMITLLPTLRKILESRPLNPFHPKPHDGSGVGRFLGYIKDLVDERYDDLKANHTDILQSFIKPGLNRPQVESEALVTVFGGTDTTSTALRNIIFYLSTTPRAYRALQSEIDGAVKTMTRPVIRDAEAKALPYLQAWM
ncbi:uncharacterized protein ACLA_002830 [Aspergillus clavatus NRRL 1]|uniref:Cytochrome P450 n=1 Tax=Aspergillus clavatus (strain ATCC 1007 / CBS 513.65 / DSM 816 / NCTC 3887 / NRRL 1 / QM 1276 / 107) TaxID=344612 RepID=A1C5A4_ASPCL|nr:uncharacterized protein ACLA_002830 [Aspergillus clavatus NRRL 1]EAW14872.1 hypothetical protein ACLA_002830 [Aspergillus clavatus NRRL 1]